MSAAGGAAGSRSDPVCLLSDSSDDEQDSNNDNDNSKAQPPPNGGGSGRKRPHPPATSAAASSSDGSATSGTNIADRFAPFRLFATSNDTTTSGSNGGTTTSKAPFISTLRETLGLDGPDSQTKLGPMQWMVLSNYLIDFDYVIHEIPELLSLKRVLVFYGSPQNEGGPSAWKRSTANTSSCPDFVRLVPSDPKRSKYNPLPFKMEWGVHHSKFFLVGYKHCVRVVIHTSNLRGGGIDFKYNCQGAYVQDFPLKDCFCTNAASSSSGDANGADSVSQSKLTKAHCDSEDAFATSSPFEEDLIAYLETYRQTTRYTWPLDIGATSGSGNTAAAAVSNGGAQHEVPLLLTEVLRRYDYSSAYGVLIPSVPGYHRLTNCPYGHLKIRDVIRRHTSRADGGGRNNGGGTILCQFSSLGGFSLKWLHELMSSLDLQAAWSSLQALPRGATSSPLLDKLKIIWPTMEEVRNAAAGYVAGGPIPGRMKNTDKSFLRSFYHRWSSTTDPLRKRAYPGHIKTFLQLSKDETEIEWFLLTSHNLSTAALGQIQNNSSMGERVLFTRHWELGVFVSPYTLRNVNLNRRDGESGGEGAESATKRSRSAGNDDDEAANSSGCQRRVRMVPYTGTETEYGPNDVILPLPFDTSPTRYSSQDVPWATDRKSSLPDPFGRVML